MHPDAVAVAASNVMEQVQMFPADLLLLSESPYIDDPHKQVSLMLQLTRPTTSLVDTSGLT